MLALADELRQMSYDPLVGTQAGRVFVAPSVWQGVDRMAKAALGGYREKRGEKLREKQAEERARRDQRWLAAAMRQYSAPRYSNSTAPAMTQAQPLIMQPGPMRTPLPPIPPRRF